MTKDEQKRDILEVKRLPEELCGKIAPAKNRERLPDGEKWRESRDANHPADDLEYLQ